MLCLWALSPSQRKTEGGSSAPRAASHTRVTSSILLGKFCCQGFNRRGQGRFHTGLLSPHWASLFSPVLTGQPQAVCSTSPK